MTSVSARTVAHRSRRIARAFTLPAVLAVLLGFALPVAQVAFLSFTRWPGVGDPKWVGLANFERVFGNPTVLSSLATTLTYAIVTTALVMAMSLLLAAAVSRGMRGFRFYRVVWFLPAVAPAAAAGVFWATAFQPKFGAVNAFLAWLGLGDEWAPLADPKWAILPPILVTTWGTIGIGFLLLLGAMEQVPITLYEASTLDGAGPTRQFFGITIPMILPTAGITAVLILIGTFNNFATIFAMTQGGPGFATTTLPLLVYKSAFKSGDFGGASVIALVSSIVLVAVGFLAMRFSRSRQA